MNQISTIKKTLQLDIFQDLFLQELIEQFRLADTANKYTNWSDGLLIDRLIFTGDREKKYLKRLAIVLDFDPLDSLLTYSFYKAISAKIEKQTGHETETFVHLSHQNFTSVVISCGGVIVLYSLIGGDKNLGFVSLEELLQSAKNNIDKAIAKASRYLDVVK
jgi:probable nitrogen fixation protein